MNKNDLLNLGLQYRQEGRMDLAIEMWQRCAAMDPSFGPAFINLFNAFKEVGNLAKAREAVNHWMNCPLTPNTIDFVPMARKELEEINKRLNPPKEPPK